MLEYVNAFFSRATSILSILKPICISILMHGVDFARAHTLISEYVRARSTIILFMIIKHTCTNTCKNQQANKPEHTYIWHTQWAIVSHSSLFSLFCSLSNSVQSTQRYFLSFCFVVCCLINPYLLHTAACVIEFN